MRARRAFVALVVLAGGPARPAVMIADPLPQSSATVAAPDLREDPAPSLIEPGSGDERSSSAPEEREYAALEDRLRELEGTRARHATERDRLLAELSLLSQARSPAARLGAFWRRPRVRARLADTVTALALVQRRILALRLRRDDLLAASEERRWTELDDLLGRSESTPRAGAEEDADLAAAVSRVLAGGGDAPPGAPRASVGRFRSLVERLAKVNVAMERRRADARAPAPRFLGVAERGRVLSGPAEPPSRAQDRWLDEWLRLRRSLADEIVIVATAVTDRVRRSSNLE